MGNQFLSLSLFIMLLSFFIVLNAMSTIEVTKSSPILNSLSLAFSKKEQLDQADIGLTETENSSNRRQEAGNSLDRLEGLFTTHITGVETRQNRFGTQMFAEVPIEAFEDEIFSVIVENKNDQPQQFIPMLRSLLEAESTAAPYRMDMVLYLPASFSVVASESAEALNVYTARIAKIAEVLEQAGLPKTLFSIGVAEGDSGMLGLHFHRQYTDDGA